MHHYALVSTLVAIGLALAAAFGFLRWYEGKAVYFPLREIQQTPRDAGLAFEDVELNTTDGETIHGWFVPAAKSDAPVFLFLHGNGGNVSHRLEKLAIFHSLGVATLIIDYRGYGRSTGSPSEPGIYTDAQTAYRYLTDTKGIDPKRIVLYGESLGSAVAVHLGSEVPAGGVVIESGFTSVPDIAQKMFPFLPARWIVKHRFDSIAKVDRINAPLLIMHSREDEMFEMSHPERLLAAARDPKRLVELRGGHNDAFRVSEADYRAALASFIDDLHIPPPAH